MLRGCCSATRPSWQQGSLLQDGIRHAIPLRFDLPPALQQSNRMTFMSCGAGSGVDTDNHGSGGGLLRQRVSNAEGRPAAPVRAILCSVSFRQLAGMH